MSYLHAYTKCVVSRRLGQDFLLTRHKYDGPVPKKERVWLRAAIAFSEDAVLRTKSLERSATHGKKTTYSEGRTPNRFLLRRRLRQGAPYKCPLIRELLWDWFVDIRASLATTISPRFVLMKARMIAETILREQRKLASGFCAMPKLDKHWLLRWKRDHGVVFRKPNARYKCSKEVLLRRLRAMWRNIIVVRYLAQLMLENSLADRIYGIDEKPIHFNESGSKNVRTLELAGAPVVKLKQNHANTRERASWMTCVTSDRAAALQPRKLPTELLFKARSTQRTRKLCVPDNMNVSVAWASKGSYREEHVLNFLGKWLDPWTAERASCHDYRILMLDVAKSHISDKITQFAWSRGYVTLYHYGCTTGVCQVNDTDLHAALEQLYLEIEQEAFNDQQLYDPGSVSRSPQDVLDDAARTWRLLNHVAAVEGHWRTGLSNKLDGTEDHMIIREARELWLEADMRNVRLRAMAEVEARVAAGEIKEFGDWEALIVHPDDAGILHDEGAELVAVKDPEDKSWITAEDEQLIIDDEADVLNQLAQATAAQPEVVVVAQAGDGEQDVADANKAASRLALLKRLRAHALEAKVPTAFFSVDREVGQLERGLQADSVKTKHKVNQVLRRAVEEAADKQAAEIARLRAKARKAQEQKRKIRAQAAKAAQAKKAAQEAKKAHQKKLDALPVTWSAKDCGDPKNGYSARKNCLERLKLRSPALTFEENAQWTRIRDKYARAFPKSKKGPTGVLFINEINEVLKRLGSHYDGKTKYNSKGEGGDKAAFSKFFRSMSKKIPQPAVAATM